ncbi:MAG: ABC transporter substrate-binding protein [Spirochaetia bacterium]|jgi:NitT/TauT family transport system substrate-binding protein|nr:ABC transporter substrate-binding protein [Spirochaetia bacterium]
MTRIKSGLVVFFFLAFMLVLQGCGSNSKPIRIGTNAWPPCEIWQIAEQQGYFGKVPVEIIRFSTWSDNMSALYKGNIDITHATYFNAVYYHDKGEAAKIILASDVIEGSDGLTVKNYIISGSDLKGKVVAVEINTDEHFLLKKALEEFGLTEEDITVQSSTSYESMQLFIDGEVDACFTYDPFLHQAAEEGEGKVIWTTLDLPSYMIDTLVAQDNTINTRKKDLKVVLAAWYKAQEYIKNNSDEAFAFLAASEGMTPEDFEGFYNSFTLFTPQDNLEIFSSSSFTARLEEMNDFLFTHQAIKSKANVKELFTSDVVKGLK